MSLSMKPLLQHRTDDDRPRVLVELARLDLPDDGDHLLEHRNLLGVLHRLGEEAGVVVVEDATLIEG